MRKHYSEAGPCIGCGQRNPINWTEYEVNYKKKWYSVFSYDTFNKKLLIEDENGAQTLINMFEATAHRKKNP